MSKIEKLQILGVRSFDNRQPMTIELYAPLTLIVGMNGSGKTTIIECLKYITTGELPPNARLGGGFIHDPNLCGEKEVLAQIKVQFRSTEGVRMVCTRSLQLTVKKNTRSMKTLEGSIMMIRNGEKTSLSSRTAEMDQMMPRFLGVSKAILESVIFCHQEEALWPLSEPKKLKERFDEIFEALKYTRAIDNIKILQKNKRSELVTLKLDEEHAKVDNDRAKRCKTDMLKLDAEIEELRTRHDHMETQVEEAGRRAEEAWRKAGEAELIVGKLTGKRIERDTKEESVLSLRENLEEMTDSDAELQSMLEQYESRVQAYEDDLSRQKESYTELAAELQETRERLSAKERECGIGEAQQQNYERQLEERAALIKEAARSHNIRGFDLDLDEAQVQEFMNRISKLARDQNAAFEKARREAQNELQHVQGVLNGINEKRSALNQRRENARQSIALSDRKIESLQADLAKINVDEGGRGALDAKLQEGRSGLDRAKHEHEQSNWDAEINKASDALRAEEERSEQLNHEQAQGVRRARESAELDLVQKELRDRQQRLETMLAAHKERLDASLGPGWTAGSIETDYDRVLKLKEAKVGEATRNRDATSREKEQVDFQLNMCRAELKTKRAALKAAEDAIQNAVDCKPENYLEELEQLAVSRDYIKNDTDSYKMLLQYFDACLKTAREHKACKTCLRPLKDKEFDRMVRTLDAEKEKISKAADSGELQEAEEELKRARAVNPDFDTWERLTSKELPALQSQEKKLAEQRTALIAKLEEQDDIVASMEAEQRDVSDLVRTVRTIAKYSTDIASFTVQVADLSAQQKFTGAFRGVEAIQNDLKTCNNEKKRLQTQQADLISARDRGKTLINKLELECRDTLSKQSEAEYKLKELKAINGQIEEHKGLNGERRDSIKAIESELHGLGPALATAQTQYDDITRRAETKDRELQAETSKMSETSNRLRVADQQIRRYIEAGEAEKLDRSKREAQHIKADVQRLIDEQERFADTAKKLESQLRNHSETKRSISDNQRYRRDLRQLELVSAEIKELERHNAEADKERHEHEAGRWQRERNKLAAEQATVVGQMSGLDRQILQHQKDWESDYKHAAGKYKAAHVRVETTKAAIEDLGRYGGALDKAIMKYHSLKMEEINRIIEELWRKTYQGTDVDTILIRSETETVRANKSYNYRVCMIKQDAEMDMRGRCSAGQKVLASIIIRLALAECFGVNCGLIALDEPTTNLDRNNISALAQSLAEIIKVRRAQKNFQLIVITHDEEFLKEMGCADYADSYFRVSRDEAQKSVIEKQNIVDVSPFALTTERLRQGILTCVQVL
jgi:DNA repair protein RAD50